MQGNVFLDVVFTGMSTLPERGTELLERGTELKDQLLERGIELKGQVLARSSELRDRAVEAAERAREGVTQAPQERWTKLACAGLALIALMVIVRRVRAS